MTEIPKHLLKRAQRAREQAEADVNGKVIPMVTQAIPEVVSAANRHVDNIYTRVSNAVGSGPFLQLAQKVRELESQVTRDQRDFQLIQDIIMNYSGDQQTGSFGEVCRQIINVLT